MLLIPVQKSIDIRIGELKTQSISFLEEKLGRKITYSSVSPSIFLFIEFRDLAVSEGTELLLIDRIRVHYNLFRLLSGKPVTALKEISLVKSSFTFDMEKDQDLIRMFTGMSSGNKRSFITPEIRISGKNLNITIINGTDLISVDKLFFTLEGGESLKFSARGNIEAKSSALTDAGLISSKFNTTGTYIRTAPVFNSRIMLKSIKTDILSLRKLSLRAVYEKSALTIRKIEDSSPLDILVQYLPSDNLIKASLAAENFIPQTYFNLENKYPYESFYMNSIITGSGNVVYSTENQSVEYDGNLTVSGELKEYSENLFIEAWFAGDRSRVNFDRLFLSDKKGNINFKGGMSLADFIPNGRIYGSYKLNQFDISADLNLSGRDKTLRAAGNRLDISGISFNNFSTEVHFYNGEVDFITGFSIGNGTQSADYKENSLLLDGSLQYITDPFLNLSLKTENVPLNIIASALPQGLVEYETIIPQMEITSSMLFSTDFRKFSFSATDFLLEMPDDTFLHFSASGNNDSIEINNLSGNFNNSDFEGQLSVIHNINSYTIEIDFVFNDYPYSFNLSYYPGTGIFADGSHGFFGNLITIEGRSEFSFEFTDAPLPFENRIAEVTMGINGFYKDRQDWQITIDHFAADNLPVLPANSSVWLSGLAGPEYINLEKIRFMDILSTLDGYADLQYESYSAISVSGNFNLEAEDNESYTGDIDLDNGNITLTSRFTSAPLDRFDFLPVDGRLSGKLDLDGPLSDPDIVLDITVGGGKFNSSPFELETSMIYSDKYINLDYLRLRIKGQTLQKGSGSYNLETGDFNIETEYFGTVTNSTASAHTVITGNTIPVENIRAIPGIFYNPYSAELRLDNITANGRNIEPWKLSLTQKNKIISVSGGPGNGLKGTLKDNGSFSFSSKGQIPVRADAAGSFSKGEIELELSNMEMDLEILALIPAESIFSFTGGTAYGDVVISGDISDPDFTGRLQAVGATADIKMVPERIEPFNTGIVFDGKSMVVETVDLLAGNSAVRIESSFVMSKWLPRSFAVKIDTLGEDNLHIKYAVSQIGLSIDGFTSGNLTVIGDNFGININSDLSVDNCIITMGARKPGRTSQDRPLSIDMKFTTGKKVQFLWPTSNLPILRATADTGQKFSFSMDGLNGTYEINGDIGIKHGDVFYFQKNFYLTEGAIIFNENEAKFDPVLDFTAQIKEVDQDGEIVDIYMILDEKPVSQFSPRFESDPIKSDIEIFTILGSNVFTQVGTEQVDLTSALLLTGDIVSQFSIIRNFEDRIKDIFKLDLFSIRTQMIQNIVLDRIIGTDGYNAGYQDNTFGRYLDNTTLYLGKYFGDDIFLQALVQIGNDKEYYDDQVLYSNELSMDTTITLEWQTPLFLLELSVEPDLQDPVSSIQNTSLGLSWGYSY